ncbi:peptidoglycan-binding protein [Janibacter limosus]|uniref:Peptidoglycan-binding protein n=1 Tax=Janibacter limosus TaxID=53458 RepID=A0AC61U1V3_9MICO|nr:peptidoglycan-binding protein [Janibacter limosus]UUZ43997.1 peptidoglycan-binding protein [Janibacter limosus]
MQRELKVTADGAFGPQTEQAVKAFQKAKQLKVDGVVTPNVWKAPAGKTYTKDGATSGATTGLGAYLTTTIRSGSRGDAVKALQRELKVTADGSFGPQTEQAVRTFQKAKQLKVDGVVTPNVWKAPAGKTYTKDGATSTPTTRPASAKVVTTTEFDKLRSTVPANGARGAEVKVLQRALGGIAVDGSYGSGTVKAVRAFPGAGGPAGHRHRRRKAVDHARAACLPLPAVPQHRPQAGLVGSGRPRPPERAGPGGGRQLRLGDEGRGP